MRELKILIADVQPLIRLGSRAVLEAQPGWTVCAEAVTGFEAVALALKYQPDLVITGISLPGINGLDVTRQIRRDLPKTEVLILTLHDSDTLAAEAFSLGARGYILKSDNLRILISAVETIAEGKTFLSGSVSGLMLGRLPTNGGHAVPLNGILRDRQLTSREREVVQLLAEADSNKEIATKLGISVKTVDAHRTNIMRRLNIHSVTELVRYAIRERIIAP